MKMKIRNRPRLLRKSENKRDPVLHFLFFFRSQPRERPGVCLEFSCCFSSTVIFFLNFFGNPPASVSRAGGQEDADLTKKHSGILLTSSRSPCRNALARCSFAFSLSLLLLLLLLLLRLLLRLLLFFFFSVNLNFEFRRRSLASSVSDLVFFWPAAVSFWCCKRQLET